MDVSEEALLISGFSAEDVQKIKNNVERYGGTLEEVVSDLARRFSTLIWITAICALVFMLLVIFSSPVRMLAGGLSFVVGIAIMLCAQPPLLSYKSWRYRRTFRR